MTGWKILPAGLLVAALGCGPAEAALHAVQSATSSFDGQTSTFDWKGTVAAGKTLEVRGVNGRIEASPADGQVASVHATLKGHHSDPADVYVQVVEHDGSFTLCAVYPGIGGRENRCEPGGGHMSLRHNDVSVRFEVRVPKGVRLLASTVNGSVKANGLEGPIVAKTVNGSVKIGTTSWAEATSVNGSIHAALGSLGNAGSLDFKTVNGSVTVVLPPDAGADVHAETMTGGISTDFPITISGEYVSHHASGTIGGGGPELDLKTISGGIHLVKGR